MQSGDNLIVAELSRLSRFMLEIMELPSILLKKGVNVYILKGNYELKDVIQSKKITFTFRRKLSEHIKYQSELSDIKNGR